MCREKLILVGNGMSGVHCIEEILKNNPNRYSITIFGSEKHVNYNRILLSSVLQGISSMEKIFTHDLEWYKEHRIQLFTEETVFQLDTVNKTITTDKKRKVPFDKLIIATGSVPFILPLPGADKEGVMSFRTIEDAQKITDTANHYKKAAVIGGGLLGLEAARGLVKLGMEVNVVHNSKNIMDKQLDPVASKLLQKELEIQGMRFLLGKNTKEISGEGRVEKVVFKDGTEIDADLVIMAVGVRPNIHFVKESDIHTNRAIVVNDYMQTNIPGIYAVGECAEHRGEVYGIVKPLYEQGRVLAKHICDLPTEGYKGSILSTKLKISGAEVFSAGQFNENQFTKSFTLYDDDQVYKKLVFLHNKMVGAILYGDIRDHIRLLDMIEKKKGFSDKEKALLLGPQKESDHLITTMLQSSMVCNCNGVTKRTIMEAVKEGELTTVEQVKKCTKASSSCGGCKPLVEELLSYMSSEDFNEDISQESMCSCTSLTEDEMLEEIQTRGLSSVKEVVSILGWRNQDGCTTCRPALEYYLRMIDPEYKGAENLLYMSEMMNAAKQKDGTYTIVPQMYGGITNGEQLGRIAEVAVKYQLPRIAITDDQRIRLSGIKKEDLIDIWNDLNMKLIPFLENSGASVTAYAPQGECYCEKNKHAELAILLEKEVEFLITPYRVEIGVCPCIHNISGLSVKDIGVLKQDRGWEIYVGGSDGPQKEGELLTVAQTEDEAVEVICGFIQYYRETAKYKERTWNWAERIGFIHIREVLFDQEVRKLLLQHLEAD